VSDQRLEGFRVLRQAFTLLTTRLENFEKELQTISNGFQNNQQVSGELRRLFTSLGDIKSVITSNVRTIQVEEPITILGDIHGDGEGYLRLQSAFRALTQENVLLRDKYVRWQKELPSTSLLADKERIIAGLSKQIVELSNEIATLRSQGSVSVNVSPNTE
jgi:hypothetical protein